MKRLPLAFIAHPVHNQHRAIVATACFLWGTVALSTSQADSRDHWPWRSASLGGGGYMQGVVFCSAPGTLHTYSDVGGVWKSTDHGATWRIISGGLPSGDGYRNVRGLHVDAANPLRLLAAVGNQWTSNRGIYASANGGATWVKRLDARFLGNESHRSTGQILAAAGGAIFAGTAGDGLWRSLDGGATWQNVGLLGFNITDVKVLSDGKLAVCAISYTLPGGTVLQGGFFRLGTDLEIELQGPQGPEEIVEAANGLVGIFNSARAMISTDGGVSWEDYSQGLPIDEVAAAASFTSESRFRALAAGQGFVLLASSRGTIHRRNTDAATWTPVTRQSVTEIFEGRQWWGRIQPGRWQHFGAATGSVTIDPANSSRWWLTDWYGLYESTDAGANWTLKIDGIESTVVHCLDDSVGGTRFLAGIADNGPLVSDNRGETYDASLPFSNLRAMGISQDGRVFGVGSSSGEWQANTLWVSQNSGSTWSAAAAGGLPATGSRNMNSIAVPRAAPDTVYVALAGSLADIGGVYRSTDAGATFQALRTGMEAAGQFFQSSIWSGGSELVLAGDGSLICASRSTGQAFRLPPGESTWVPAMAGLPGQPWDLRAGENAIHATRGTGGVWTSSDGGTTWARISTRYATVLAADPGDDARLAVLVSGAIMWTADGGSSWSSLPLPPHREVKALAFHGDRIVAGTNGGGLFFSDALVSAAPEGSLVRSVDGSTKFHISQFPGIGVAGAGATLRFLDNVSLSGGAVSRSGSWITYTPPSGIRAWQIDSISYIAEGLAGMVSGSVSLGVPAVQYAAAGSLLSVTENPHGTGMAVVIAAIPGVTYQIRASSNLSSWTLIESATADPLGLLEITDTGATGSARFYSISRP
jgi:hypothetical protein